MLFRCQKPSVSSRILENQRKSTKSSKIMSTCPWNMSLCDGSSSVLPPLRCVFHVQNCSFATDRPGSFSRLVADVTEFDAFFWPKPSIRTTSERNGCSRSRLGFAYTTGNWHLASPKQRPNWPNQLEVVTVRLWVSVACRIFRPDRHQLHGISSIK